MILIGYFAPIGVIDPTTWFISTLPYPTLALHFCEPVESAINTPSNTDCTSLDTVYPPSTSTSTPLWVWVSNGTRAYLYVLPYWLRKSMNVKSISLACEIGCEYKVSQPPLTSSTSCRLTSRFVIGIWYDNSIFPCSLHTLFIPTSVLMLCGVSW